MSYNEKEERTNDIRITDSKFPILPGVQPDGGVDSDDSIGRSTQFRPNRTSTRLSGYLYPNLHLRIPIQQG